MVRLFEEKCVQTDDDNDDIKHRDVTVKIRSVLCLLSISIAQ